MSLFLSAEKIHDGKQFLPQNTVLEIDAEGTVLAVHTGDEFENIVHYKGILCPGFVNAHCHVELSHMKSTIPEHTGLTGFLQQVMQKRNDFTEDQKKTARENAVQEMLANGIVAVGDIANTTDTLSLRKNGKLHWYTFVESIGFSPERAAISFDYAVKTWAVFEAQITEGKIVKQAIVPHAPYSVSGKLFELIAAHQKGATLSVHNQETEDENHYYQTKTGGFTAFLSSIGIDDSQFLPTGQTSLQSYAAWLSADSPLMLVHNTFSGADDIHFVKSKFPNLYWCLCPNANRYIEKRLPDIELLDNSELMICVGTDSLASNHQLSVLAELKTIDAAFPQIGWEKLLRWATYNGACALQMEQTIGCFEAGKTPGIVLLNEHFEVQKLY